MPKGIYKRTKRGRPKGSKNKNRSIKETLSKSFHMLDNTKTFNPDKYNVFQKTTPTEPPSFISRLEAATVKYEQAVKEVVETLKGLN